MQIWMDQEYASSGSIEQISELKITKVDQKIKGF